MNDGFMLSASSPLLLGSGSPRRRELLQGLGLPLWVVVPKAEEPRWQQEEPSRYLENVVAFKLTAVAEVLRAQPECPTSLVADTIVVVDDQVLGKPQDAEDARRLLERIMGRSHTVYTRYALALQDAPAHAAASRTVRTRVTMRQASSEAIVAYAKTGEGLDKAGAYAAQGLGSAFVESIEGSYANVIGLPVCEVVVDLLDLGLLKTFPPHPS